VQKPHTPEQLKHSAGTSYNPYTPPQFRHWKETNPFGGAEARRGYRSEGPRSAKRRQPAEAITSLPPTMSRIFVRLSISQFI